MLLTCSWFSRNHFHISHHHKDQTVLGSTRGHRLKHRTWWNLHISVLTDASYLFILKLTFTWLFLNRRECFFLHMESHRSSTPSLTIAKGRSQSWACLVAWRISLWSGSGVWVWSNPMSRQKYPLGVQVPSVAVWGISLQVGTADLKVGSQCIVIPDHLWYLREYFGSKYLLHCHLKQKQKQRQPQQQKLCSKLQGKVHQKSTHYRSGKFPKGFVQIVSSFCITDQFLFGTFYKAPYRVKGCFCGPFL